jgi:hypothetical protein
MRKGSKKENYQVNHDYFKIWSHDMAYVLGILVADGNIQKNGNYVKIEVCPKDRILLEFVRDQITPNYVLKQSRPTEIRWYPASATLKSDLVGLGVVPAKTGKEVVPSTLPEKYKWDFVRGLFDGDGTVSTSSVSITSNCKQFILALHKLVGLGRVKRKKMNWDLEIERKSELKIFFTNLYSTGSFALDRKKEKMQYLVSEPVCHGRFSEKEDLYLLNNYQTQTRAEMAVNLGRSGTSIKNRLRKLSVRKAV